jgi:hypothetical protein
MIMGNEPEKTEEATPQPVPSVPAGAPATAAPAVAAAAPAAEDEDAKAAPGEQGRFIGYRRFILALMIVIILAFPIVKMAVWGDATAAANIMKELSLLVLGYYFGSTTVRPGSKTG